ncbi:uncharacterized protein BDV14DRAFT_139856 [Aspergillus stella-maris]|uniref:uncharacterized protein n=1 Tax=Aspergillus stella-maris TaxID=1810926 RepID=UPI003CCE42FD
MPPDIRANPFRPVYSGPRFHHLPPRPPIPDGHRNKIIPSSPSDKPEPRATSRSSGDQPEPRIKKDATAIHPSNPDSPCATDCHTSTKSANDKALGTTTDDYHIQTQESTVIQDSPTLPMSDPTPAADSNDDIRRKITQALRRLRKHHARQEAQVQAFKRASRRTKEGIEEYHRWQFEQAQRVGADVTDGMDLEEATVPQPANCPTKSQEPQNNKDMDCEQARESQPVDNYTREVKGSEQASKSQRTNNYTRDVNDHAESQEASMDAEDPLNAKQNSEAEQYSLRDRPLPATTHSAEDGLQDVGLHL